MLLDKIKSHSSNVIISQDAAAAVGATKEESSQDGKCLKKAIEVCHKTKAIIDDVASGGGGALPAEENRWFGELGCSLLKREVVGAKESSLDERYWFGEWDVV